MRLKNVGSNMTELEFNGNTILFSYQTPVACHSESDMKFHRTEKKWSPTTTRHINKWLKSQGDPQSVEVNSQDYFDGLATE